jgi:hypothetical protein
MYVTECDVPMSSVLDRAQVGNADYRDSHKVRSRHIEFGIVDIFFRIFAHLPFPAKALLIVRNKFASLSVLKVSDGGAISVVVTTVCTVRNQFGKYYLRAIVPFHRRGLRRMLLNAVAANRL